MTATKPAPAPERVPPAAAAALRYLQRVPGAARDLWIGGVLVAICVVFAISSPYFLTRENWLNTSSTATEVLLLAIGPIGIGTEPAVIALVIFALPPIVTNQCEKCDPKSAAAISKPLPDFP